MRQDSPYIVMTGAGDCHSEANHCPNDPTISTPGDPEFLAPPPPPEHGPPPHHLSISTISPQPYHRLLPYSTTQTGAVLRNSQTLNPFHLMPITCSRPVEYKTNRFFSKNTCCWPRPTGQSIPAVNPQTGTTRPSFSRSSRFPPGRSTNTPMPRPAFNHNAEIFALLRVVQRGKKTTPRFCLFCRSTMIDL